MNPKSLKRTADKYNTKHYRALYKEKVQPPTPREHLINEIQAHAEVGYYSMLINKKVSQEDKDWFREQGFEVDEYGNSLRRISEGQIRFNWG